MGPGVSVSRYDHFLGINGMRGGNDNKEWREGRKRQRWKAMSTEKHEAKRKMREKKRKREYYGESGNGGGKG